MWKITYKSDSTGDIYQQISSFPTTSDSKLECKLEYRDIKISNKRSNEEGDNRKTKRQKVEERKEGGDKGISSKIKRKIKSKRKSRKIRRSYIKKSRRSKKKS